SQASSPAKARSTTTERNGGGDHGQEGPRQDKLLPGGMVRPPSAVGVGGSHG
ncbi:hypothetical protein Dimus_016096, partial [Dionaea muscipula]